MVAVQVQRPGIRATVEQDLDILLRLAVRLEKHARWARAVGADHLISVRDIPGA